MRAIVIGLGLVMCTPAFAEWKGDGSTLLEACRAAVKHMDTGKVTVGEADKSGSCFGYIAGFNEGLKVALERRRESVCYHIPAGVTGGQMARVVEKYLRDNPQDLHKPMSSTVLAALVQAFPCE